MPTVHVRYMVNDVEAAVAFYTSHLGSTIISKTLPAFADVTRGDLRLLLSGPASSAGRSMPDGRQPSPGGWNRIHLIVEDLAAEVHHFLLTLYAEFRFNGVRIISRADSPDSDDDHAKLGFQMRGIVNELYLDDLREKTLRGQKGQKARGFTVGEATYGYTSVPVGEMRIDRRGRPRPDGYRMVIEPSEAEVILRIFRDFGNSKAIKSLSSRSSIAKRSAAGASCAVAGPPRPSAGSSRTRSTSAAGPGTGPRLDVIRNPVGDGSS